MSIPHSRRAHPDYLGCALQTVMLGGNRQSEPKTLEALAQDGLTLFSDGIPIGLLRGLRYGIDAIAGDGVRLGLYNSERAAALAIIAHLSARGAP